jgi:hypothetical protein
MQTRLYASGAGFPPLTILITIESATEAAGIFAAYHALDDTDLYAGLERWQEQGVTSELRTSAVNNTLSLIANLALDIQDSAQWPLVEPHLPAYLHR